MQLADIPAPVLAHGNTVLPAPVLAHGGVGPPPFTPARLFTEIQPISLVALFIVVAAALYGYGWYRLRQRGDHWPPGRVVAFAVGGLGSIALVTVSGIEAYDDTLLSVHMVQHMILSMIGPIFLALGAPVTLALRTLRPHPRKIALAALHSRVVRLLTFPLVAFGIFVANPFILYFTKLYQLSLENDWLHELIHVHFIVTGCLFFWPLVGIDPLPNRWPYPARALLMVLSVPFHTVLGLTIMQSKTLIGGDYYPDLHLGWANPWSDQVLAGGILWAGGEFVSVTLLGILVIQWIKQSEREARRIDRALDRAEAEERARAAAAVAAENVVSAPDSPVRPRPRAD